MHRLTIVAALFASVCVTVPPQIARAQGPSAGVDSSASPFEALPRNQRPKLVVQPFEFNVVPTQEQLDEMNSFAALATALRGGDPNATMQATGANLGRAAADLLTEQLMNTQRFRVLERRVLDQVKAEQQVSADGPQAGKLAGAQFIVTGAITKFGVSKQKSRWGAIAGGVVGGATRGVVTGIGSGKTVYEIGMTLRVVDAETGEVLASVATEGAVEGDKSRNVAGVGLAGGVLGGLMSKSTTGEREKRIAEALAVSAANLTVKLVEQQQKGALDP
jgi:curli biogenesis system outer membrane secretion channel CsgG